MNIATPLLLAFLASLVAFAPAAQDQKQNECKVTADLPHSAINCGVMYKKKKEDDSDFIDMFGTGNLTNCDVTDEQWHCSFDVENCDQSKYNYKITPIDVDVSTDLEQTYQGHYVAGGYYRYGPIELYDFLKKKAGWNTPIPVFKLIKRTSPEHMCPGRVPLYWYERPGDNALSTSEDNTWLKSQGWTLGTYGEFPNPMGFCAPEAGRCGATDRLYGYKGFEKGKSINMYTTSGKRIDGKIYNATDACFVWV